MMHLERRGALTVLAAVVVLIIAVIGRLAGCSDLLTPPG